jgi:hypothetical protein
MSLDFQQIRQQIVALSGIAKDRSEYLQRLRQLAEELLHEHASDLDALRGKVETVVRNYDPSLRCALPASEHLDACFPVPPLPNEAIILASDGSQIFMDRHASVEYFVINIGVIQARLPSTQAPRPSIFSDLYFGDQLNFNEGYFDEDKISLMRDLRERRILAELAGEAKAGLGKDNPIPVITLTDGHLELWGAKSGEDDTYKQSLQEYLASLDELHNNAAIAAGYVDKPGEDYLVRLLEVASQPGSEAKNRPLRGVRDRRLFENLLKPGERSAVFGVQSRAAMVYKGHAASLALHFFYLNIGRPGHDWLARVDIPAWVAGDPNMLDVLHAILVDQCKILGTHPYPYLLHRAHETAVVGQDERKQVEAMINQELRKHGIVGETSHKLDLKVR